MNYFDIFRIAYDDLTIIASNPEAFITSVEKDDVGYIGKIILSGEYPERESNVSFVHENEFDSVEEAYSDLDQIIETIKIAFENTKQSEAKSKNHLSE